MVILSHNDVFDDISTVESNLDIYDRFHLDNKNRKSESSTDTHQELLEPAIVSKIEAAFSKSEFLTNVTRLYEGFVEPNRIKYSATIHYPVQFECLRIACGYKRKEFLKALNETQKWASSGGQTGSDFYKTESGRFIAKSISQNEFEMFKDNALSYFKFIFSTVCANKETFISKVLALIEMKVGKEDKKFIIVMEGVTFGIKINDQTRVFDLKGSKMNRLRKTHIKTKTNLDTNYMLERNGDPLVVQMPADVDFFATLERDVAFLRDRDIVDYSLLLVLQKQDKVLRVGIIDYLRKYDLKKKIEHGLKKLKNLGQDPTIVNPSQYADRFLQFMRCCFVAQASLPEGN